MEARHDPRLPTLADAEADPEIRIMLAQRPSFERECLKALVEIESGFNIVGACDTAVESLKGVRDWQPDIVLTDLSLPGRSGVDLLVEIRRKSPLTGILVLTGKTDRRSVCSALHAGADGYILHSSSADELTLAIRAVFWGQRFLCKAIEGKILSDYLSGYWPASSSIVTQPITAREILESVTAGRNGTVPRELGVRQKNLPRPRTAESSRR